MASLGSSSNPLDGIIYKIAHTTDYEAVVELLYSDFFTDEPMSDCLKLCDGKTRNPILDEFVYEALNENLTLIAVDGKSGKLLGCCVNVVAHKTNYEEISADDYLKKYQGSTFRHIMHVLYNVNRDANDIYDKFNSEVLFDIKMLATDKKTRRGGLGTDLLKRSVALARCLGYKACKTESTGLFSRKAFLKLGFSVSSECHYKDFQTEDGDTVFAGAAELHGFTCLMTLKL